MLLTAEMSSRFRAVFSFGPVSRADAYGRDLLPVDFSRFESREAILRMPDTWLPSIRGRVFILEGEAQGNIGALRIMKQKNTNPLVTFVPVPGATHFSILAAANKLLATKILADTGATPMISATPQEIQAAMH